ncbi:MAG: HD domain-containing protein [Lachnospiraceae bacterium]|nr:HD domain-containing protein [Lachnospiraceae bacterium]
MFELIRAHQLNIMLALCAICLIMAVLLLITKFLPARRKWILINMELVATFLLFFDRLAYIYSGDISDTGHFMVRLSNFMVFFLTSGIVFAFNLYLMDWLNNEGEMTKLPLRLKAVSLISVVGMFLVCVSSYTNLFYYFDENNVYHRGPGFLIAYAIPLICPLIQFIVIWQYRRVFSRLIFISLMLYIFVPILCGIVQIFSYGLSIVNMAMVLVSVSLYIFTYMDINNEVLHAHEIEIQNMIGERERMRRLFDQTATAFVSAVEKKDDFTKGNSVRIAEYAKKIAEMAGKDEDECQKAYYAALLHDVGMIGVPDKVIKNEADPDKWDYDAMRKKPLIGDEILSSISEYPYLRQGAHYSHERYDGSGYPEGLKGEEIPEIARIVAVADAYVTMTTRKRYREARPVYVAREAFVKGAGETFDPEFADIMVKIIDSEGETSQRVIAELEKSLSCEEYRSSISAGIPVEEEIKKIRFEAELCKHDDHGFTGPAVILFDSYDRRVHENPKSIEAYRYVEYGEVWFDEHSIITAARNMKETPLEVPSRGDREGAVYEITSGRYGDHVKMTMTGPDYAKTVIVALPGGSTGVCIALTGEHCELADITVEPTGESFALGDIPRIAEEISYIDHIESDIRNIQIDRTRSGATEGVRIGERTRIRFHAVSLPSADLVWHCPYVVIFYSGDGTVGGEGYREYALIKLNGEIEEGSEGAENSFKMKRDETFPGWNSWKETCKKGIECEIRFRKKSGKILLTTENLGVNIEDTITVTDKPEAVYAALTGDQVALTDIRVF